MYADNKVLAIIPARGGSKGVPKKNIRDLAGKPLIAWTIQEVKKSKYIDRCIVSTDDDEIINVSKELGGDVPFKRPAELATDEATSMDVILHALKECPGYDIIVLLQPTSPMRKAEDIDGCVEYMIKRNSKVCVTITQAKENPFWMYTLQDNGIMNELLSLNRSVFHQRQSLPAIYQLNGAVFVANVNWLFTNKTFFTKETIGYIMTFDHSYDIDTEEDLEFLNWKMSSR